MGLGKTYSAKYLLDSNNSSGVAGQLLSTTESGIDWVNANTVPGAGLWLENGNDIYNSNSGNVGIGTTTPTESMLVLSAGTTGSVGGGQAGITMINKFDNPDNNWSILPVITGVSNTGLSIRDNTDSADRLVIDGSGKVGIASISPDKDLTVGGTAATHGINLRTKSGSNEWVLWQVEQFFSQEGYMRMFYDNVAKIQFRANGDSYFAGGKVGIGKTNPGNILDVAGDTDISGQLFVTHDVNYVAKIKQTATSMSNASYTFEIDSTSHTSNMSTAGAMSVDVDSGRAFTIIGAGKVGIGTNSPSSTLTVSSTTKGLGTNEANIEINSGSDALAAGIGGSLGFASKNTAAGDPNFILAKIGGYRENATALSLNSFIAFETRTAGNSVTEKMRISSDGKVTIGNTTSVQPLTVAGAVLFRTTTVDGFENRFQFLGGGSGDPGRFFVYNAAEVIGVELNADGTSHLVGDLALGTTTASPGCRLTVRSSASTGIDIRSASNTGESFINFSDNDDANVGQIFYGHSPDRMAFRVGDDTRVIILGSNGNVGINVTSPGQKLSVAGDGSGTDDVVQITHGAGSHTGTGLNIRSANTGKALYVDGSVGAGFAEITTAYNANPNIRTSGDVVAFATSDKRFKDNLEVIQNPIDKIHKLNGYTFDWNNKQSLYKGKDYGVVAQEVEEVMPELVDTRFDGYKAVKYEKITPLLIEAIKELKAEIEELKKKIK